MTRRNLRKWAEAKQRRALVEGCRPLYAWLDEAPRFVAPSVWLPIEPKTADGPPYTHTFSLPPTEYDADGEPLPPRIQPSMTITRIVRDEALAYAYRTVGRLTLHGLDLHPLLLDHDIDRSLTHR